MGSNWSYAEEWRARKVYAMRLMTDCRVKTSIIVGRGRGGFVGFEGKDSEKALEVSEPAEDVGRRRAADDSS